MAEYRVLQIGCGGFGRFHLGAWLELGFRDSLWVAELSPQRQAWACRQGIPQERVGGDLCPFLPQVDLVDIVTGTDSHAPLATEALKAGKDLFVEKPITGTSEEARALARLVAQTGRILQVGYYYRVHPISVWIKQKIDSGLLGGLRYLSGRFMGFKRARTDVGVTHTDAIHFIDLINWLLGKGPEEVYAVTRDHFRRGLEDLSVVLLTYPGGVLAHLESGYLQPGRWNDRVVPQAKTTKDLVICAANGTIEADFETGTVELFNVRHELRDGVWHLVNEGSIRPPLPALGPGEQVRLELESFLACVKERRVPEANVWDSGVKLAELMEWIYQSAQRGQPVVIQKRPEEPALLPA